ncbi:hypothetical protein [Flavobacterium sp.]|uniref:hypothetical protein n=1 Tax=Flavobacterium sp. TaxID=239 RepID=UPI004034150C
MKRHYYILVCLLFVSTFLCAQTTETFETETQGAITFNDNGQQFNITTQAGGKFYIQKMFANTGWNGSGPDTAYIDNDTYAKAFVPVQFTISTSTGAAFQLKSLWLFLSSNNLALQNSPVTITGKLGGVVVFDVTSSGFNMNPSYQNGFSFINMATYGGQNNSNVAIDQYVVTTSGNTGYVSHDTMTWQCAPITATQATQTNVLCYGGATGSATVAAVPGAVSYDWSPGNPAGDGTRTATGLAAGQWTCTITTSCGTSSSTTFTITQPAAPLSATQSQSNVLCYGNSTGSAGVAANGGTGACTYSWSPSGGSGATASNLASGNYTVTITDANGCSIQKNFTITQPASALTATQSQANVLCYGNATGSATVTASGGTGSYTYYWSPSGGSGATAGDLASGTYTVTVTDANGCSVQKSFTITQPAAPLTATQSQNNVLCFGNATGSATVTPSGGAGNYNYLWSPSGGSGATASNLASGNYTVTITDPNGCSIQKSFTITQPAAALSAAQSQTNVLCFGSSTGSATVTPSGGTGNYSYSWSPSGGSGATAGNIPVGNYTVTITDANGCSIQKNFTITQPAAALSATGSQTDALCHGSSTGTATVIVSGGTGAYSYMWSPSGGTGATASDLVAGNYTVTITDANGCSLQKNFTIAQPAEALAATRSQVDVICNGAATGSATVAASGGTGTYIYSWSPSGGSAATANDLAAGNYTVTITDVNGCSLQKDFSITQPLAITATQSQSDALCNGEANGTATVVASGGTGAYTYLWSPAGGADATAVGLSPGNYTVTITDAVGCSAQKDFTIAQPDALSATGSQTNVICTNWADGTATVIPTGGTVPYSYSWSPTGSTEAMASGLWAGEHTVTITDANGCTIQETFTITQPETPLSATVSKTDVQCFGAATGTATVAPVGGYGNYSYYWSPSGSTEATATGLASGNHTVTVSDQGGCTVEYTITIGQPQPVSLYLQPVSTGCDGTATAFADAWGGAGYFTYSWAPYGGNEATASGLEPGTYTVTVTDMNGCSTEGDVTVSDGSECSSTTFWNGTEWSNGAPTCFNVTAVIFGDYNSALHGEITACSLMINGGAVVVEPGDDFIIKGPVYIEGGSLTFEDNSNLVQIDNSNNFGNIIYKRNSAAIYGKDYTIWSSPLSGSQTLKDFSEETLDERFYVYNTELGAYSNYQSASGIFGGTPDQVNFTVGKGYLIRMPEGLSDTSASVFNGIFRGVPNNGEIAVPVIATGNRYNAVGNPYPSPISVQDLILENSGSLDNGTLYFWRKRNGTAGTAYATLTLAAYVGATQEADAAAGNAFEDGDEANWVINPGQGFHIKAASTASQILFKNSMRRGENNGQFFRNGMSAQDTPSSSKMWLNITGSAGEFGQAALVYSGVTTNGLDYGYDGRLFNDGVIAVYTLAEDTMLAIQARAAFDAGDEVPMGYKATTAGSYGITLDHVTGIFSNGQHIYLRDDLLGTTHNLTTGGTYNFTTEAGTINDRFHVVYADALGTDGPKEDISQVIVWKNNGAISVSSGNLSMSRVKVTDIRGRLLYDSAIPDVSTFTIDTLQSEQQMLVVQVTTTGGATISKKMIY